MGKIEKGLGRKIMTMENKMISSRQCFRMGILENITLGMVVIPYATVNLAGKWHFVAFLLGLVLGALYMGIIYFLSGRLPMGKCWIEGQDGLSRGVSFIYAARFVLRAGLVMLFFGKTVQEFLLQSYNTWIIVIAFAVVCGYGGARDIEKRGRMLELLFPWMIVPIVLVAVFSISSINLEELYSGLMGVNYNMLHEGATALDVLRGGYVAFLITSSTELMMFTLPHQKDNNWRNALKTGLWILISILLAYIFIIGILGGHWVASDSQAALNVMEAAFIPGKVIERADYPVLAFWVIGVFAVISGYMFYAKESLLTGGCLRNKKQGRVCMWVVMAAVVLLAWVWSLEDVDIYLAKYLLWADVAISLILPLILIIKAGSGKLFSSKASDKVLGAKKMVLLFVTVGAGLMISGCDLDRDNDFKAISKEKGSVENRDYATGITFKEEEIIFTVADIKKYLSDATGDYETKEEKVNSDSLGDALETYYESTGKWLDLGHLSSITFEGVEMNQVREYALEMSNMPSLGKSVTVTIEAKGENENREIQLRQLIKNAYSGENFP